MEAPDPKNIRIITTLGHVDHGKTTLMDALLAANNIISPRMAGKMRYLDSREDEQERGITMESSAVSLKFTVMEQTDDGGKSPRSYIINMIDTPGHVDFSSEVSTSSRLCDGALVLVDVVEGVCTQTVAVLRQAWKDRLQPILIINKFDRLITELKLAPVEAYQHLARLIEQVNAVMGSFFAGERMEDDLRWREERERRLAARKDINADHAEELSNELDQFQEKDDEDIYFAPERGNVVFASAIDGWGFRIGKFAQLYATKLGMKEANLRRVLWGDFYLDPKTKRVIGYKHLRGRALKPLFVQFVLENVWAAYDAVMLNPNPEKVSKIISTLGLKIAPRDLKTKDNRHLLSSVFSQWLPLSTSIIQAVIDIVPAPSMAQATRVPKILHPDLAEPTVKPKNKLEEDLFSANGSPDAFVTAFVSKMFAVARKDLPENKNKRQNVITGEVKDQGEGLGQSSGSMISQSQSSGHDASNSKVNKEQGDTEEVLLGFSRLYSGVLRTGVTVYAVLPKFNGSLSPSHLRNSKHLVPVKVEALYLIMGRELVTVDHVSAGSIFAIKGLERKVWRIATLCAPGEQGVPGDADPTKIADCLINLGDKGITVSPIVRVAVEPVRPADMDKLVSGLKLLSQSDPCLETFQQETGEHVILGAGELHLERCLRDLRERFAKVEIQASVPIVPFRETAVKAPDMPPPKTVNARRGTICGTVSHNLVTFTIRASPVPEAISRFLLDNLLTIKRLIRKRDAGHGSVDTADDIDDEEGISMHGDILKAPTVRPDEFWSVLHAICQKLGGDWADIADRIWAFGPQSSGDCLLIDARKSGPVNSLRSRFLPMKPDNAGSRSEKELSEFDALVETGFQLATFQGPLCAEPMTGLAYFLESLDVDEEGLEHERSQNRIALVTGSVITAARDACRNVLLDWSPRLMLAMYSCDIQASADVLGKVYGVIAKRRGRIVAEEMKEGTALFTVSALLPVVESFGFADDIRKRTSGAASPQLIFSGFELLDQDPFWVPTTEEELEDLGEKSDRENIAKKYMDDVRERKGMFVDRKIVEFAEKQRTLKR